MRQRGSSFVVLGMIATAAPACGDDTGTTPEDASTSTTDAPATDTIPLPTGTSTTTEPGTSTVDPDTTASDTGTPSDLPGPEVDDCTRLTELLTGLPAAAPAEQQPLVDDFVRTVTYGDHGFPILCDGTLSVVHLADSGQSLSLAGDFNAWAPGEHVLQEPVDGLGFYVVSAPADAAAGLYKLVRDETEFFADPLARRFGWDEFGEYSQIDALPGRSHHERWPDFDQAIGTLEPRDLTVYVPADAEESGSASLPLLVMHDGQNLFAPDALFGGWQVGPTLDAAIGEGSLAPLVVVGIANTSARFDEYTPVSDVLDGVEVGGRADDYADFVVEGVLPFVTERYDFVDASPAATGVLGSSLGGLVSLYIGLRHADRFGQVGSMSGTIAWGTFGASNPTIVELWAEAPPLGLRVYLDSGGDAGLGCPDDGSDNYCDNLVFGDLLRQRGWVDEIDLFQRWDAGAPHNEAAWAARLLPALQDWFPGP